MRDGLDPAVAASVDVVVVTFNSAGVLQACLASLAGEPAIASVTVVDNGSSDGTGALVAEPVRLIRIGKNLGFAAAANRGAAVGHAPSLLFLNPDATVAPGAVSALAAALAARPEVGLAGPRVRNPDGSVYPSARRFPSLGVAAGHAFLGLVVPDNPYSRRYKHPEEPDWISGAAVLVRRPLFEALGGFDERYFMYVEDVDLSWRARQLGAMVALVPEAEVTHVIGDSSEGAPYRMIAVHHRSLLRFAASSARGARRLTLPAVALGLGVRTLAAWAQRVLRGRPHASP